MIQQHNVLTSSPTKKWTMARARRSAVGAPHVRTIALARDSKLFNEEVTAIIRPGVLSTELFIWRSHKDSFTSSWSARAWKKTWSWREEEPPDVDGEYKEDDKSTATDFSSHRNMLNACDRTKIISACSLIYHGIIIYF